MHISRKSVKSDEFKDFTVFIDFMNFIDFIDFMDFMDYLIFLRNECLVSDWRPHISHIVFKGGKFKRFLCKIFIFYQGKHMINGVQSCPSFIIGTNNIPG